MLAVQMKVDKDCLSCLVKQEENKSHAGKKNLIVGGSEGQT